MVRKKDKVEIGIIGMGQRTCFHDGHPSFSDCKDIVHIRAICDNSPDRLEFGRKVYQENFGYRIDGYTDYREMFEKCKLDGVYIAAPNFLHGEMTLTAFEKDINVLCEKPMEVSIKKCNKMIEVAKKKNKILAIGLQLRYRKHYHKVKEIIDSGLIGKPIMLRCIEYRGPFSQLKNWIWQKEKSGGAIVEKNCHHYDLFNLWLGENPPTRVYASGSIVKHKIIDNIKSEIIDNAWIINDFTCGARAMVGICFLGNKHYREFGIYGTEGKIFFNLEDDETIHIELNNKERIDYKIDVFNQIRGGIFRDFAQSIIENRQPLVTGEIGKKSLLIPLAAEKSIEEKRPVDISEIL